MPHPPGRHDPVPSVAPSATGWDDLTPPPAAADTPAPPRDPIRRARLLVLFVCLALLATNIWLIVRGRAHTIAQAELANTNLARAVMQRVEGSLSEVEHILDSLVYDLERADMAPTALEREQPILVNHVARTAQLRGLFVFDAQGNWVATSEPRWESSWNDAGRPYFVHHRDNRSAATWIGPPIVSRINGEWVVPVSRRLTDADGNFAGVALATLDVHHMHRLLDRFDIGEGAILLTLSGHMVARNPPLPADIGKPVPGVLADDHPSGTATARSPLDGVERLFSIEQARNAPLRTMVAAGKNQVLHNWRTNSLLQTVWVVFLCLLLVRAGRYTQRTIAQRLHAEQGLREASAALTAANARLARLAQVDDLTRLPNRRYFDRQLGQAFRQARRQCSPLAVVMVDVDEFKKYNDRYGHVEGDECLRRVAAALRASVKRPQDFVARYGGEEMVLLLPETDALGATLVAEAARVAVASMDIPHAAALAGRVTISLGLAAAVPGPQDSEQALLKAADAALYEAKAKGRNQVGVSG